MFEEYKVKPSDVIDEHTKLVIDCDSMLFKLASSAEKTSVEVFNIKEDKSEGIFKNKSEFLGRSKNKVGANCRLSEINIEREIRGLEPYELDDFAVTTIQTPIVGYTTMLENVKLWVDGLIEGLGISKDNIIYLIGDSGSFRDELKLPKKYKDNRASSIRPLMLSELRKRFEDIYKPRKYNQYEADDIIAMYQHKGYVDYLRSGKTSYIVSTIDKDAYGTSGFIINYDKAEGNFKDKNLYLIPDAKRNIGRLKLKDTTVKGLGFKWFICQAMLLGDTGDHYFTYHYFKHLSKKYGHKQCYKDIALIEDPKELLIYARDLWKSWFPEGHIDYVDFEGNEQSCSWQSFVNMIFLAAYMKRSFKDDMDIFKLYQAFGVDIYG